MRPCSLAPALFCSCSRISRPRLWDLTTGSKYARRSCYHEAPRSWHWAASEITAQRTSVQPGNLLVPPFVHNVCHLRLWQMTGDRSGILLGKAIPRDEICTWIHKRGIHTTSTMSAVSWSSSDEPSCRPAPRPSPAVRWTSTGSLRSQRCGTLLGAAIAPLCLGCSAPTDWLPSTVPSDPSDAGWSSTRIVRARAFQCSFLPSAFSPPPKAGGRVRDACGECEHRVPQCLSMPRRTYQPPAAAPAIRSIDSARDRQACTATLR